METTFTSWLTLAGLGAFHGLNPGMGWLFAVALGMQEGKRNAVWRALIPLTLGHAAGGCGGYRSRLDCGHCAVARDAALAGGDPARGPRHPAVLPSSASALGRHAGGYGRADALVFSDGVGTWRGPDGATGVSIDDARSPRPVLPRARSSQQALAGGTATLVHGAGYLAVTALAAWVVVDRLGLGTLAEGLDQPGCDLVGGTDCYRMPDSVCLRRQ